MKFVAITQRLVRNKDYPETRDALDVRWAHLAKAAGFIPLPLPTFTDFSCYPGRIPLAGVIFSGGNDLSRFSTDEFSLLRDTFEKGLLDYAVQTRMPVLGVCRGMQIIADYFGAELTGIPGHVGIRHNVELTSDSRYLGQSQYVPVQVNSYHTVGITRLPMVLKECARTADGQIEAYEHLELPIVGQMWHPEREETFKEFDLMTIRRLFNLSGENR